MDTRVWHKVGLELSDVNIYGAVKAKGGGKRGDSLGDKAVEVGVGGSLNLKGPPADVINGLVV